MPDGFCLLCADFLAYAQRVPEHAALARDFVDFLESSSDVFQRAHPPGHFTGSAWLVSGDGQRVLLTHHRKLGRWLQLGGHADGDSHLAEVALREAMEESGLSGLRLEQGIFDLDRHRIPAYGAEPEHMHYDVRYVVRAGSDENFAVSEESLALAWKSIASIAADPQASPSLHRMAARWLARLDHHDQALFGGAAGSSQAQAGQRRAAAES